MRGMRGWLVMLALLGCAPVETKVGSSRLAEADGTIDAPGGVTIEVGRGEIPKSLSGPVRVAADVDVPYREVLAAVKAVRDAGGKPVMLVTRRDRIFAMPDAAPREGEAIRLSARATGRACVSPPGTEEATCVSRVDQPKRIDRAFVRQILYKAVKEYGIKRIHVEVDPDLPWADAVRAIDGARTCCGEEAGVIVSVEPS